LALGKAYLDDSLFDEAAQVWEQAISVAGDRLPEKRSWARVRLLQALAEPSSESKAVEVWNALIQDRDAGDAPGEAVMWGGYFRAAGLISQERMDDALPVIAVALAHNDHTPASESFVDGLRIRAAEQYQRSKLRQNAIAWLRIGIEDPSRLSSSDRLLVRKLAESELLTPQDQEDWHLYLLNPTQIPDPTEPMVAAVFATPAPQPSTDIVDARDARLCWLGHFYRRQHRYDDAMTTFEEAELVAGSARQRAEAVRGQTLVLAKIASLQEQQGTTSSKSLASETRLQALNHAR